MRQRSIELRILYLYVASLPTAIATGAKEQKFLKRISRTLVKWRSICTRSTFERVRRVRQRTKTLGILYPQIRTAKTKNEERTVFNSLPSFMKMPAKLIFKSGFTPFI
nr:hypothetical protein DBT45_00685 [Aerococcus tenax]